MTFSPTFPLINWIWFYSSMLWDVSYFINALLITRYAYLEWKSMEDMLGLLIAMTCSSTWWRIWEDHWGLATEAGKAWITINSRPTIGPRVIYVQDIQNRDLFKITLLVWLVLGLLPGHLDLPATTFLPHRHVQDCVWHIIIVFNSRGFLPHAVKCRWTPIAQDISPAGEIDRCKSKKSPALSTEGWAHHTWKLHL